MPVFDFNSAPKDKKEVQCTYTTFCSNEDHATPECPILVLDNQNRKWNHHSCGVFTNQNSRPHLSLMKRTEHAVQIS